MSDNEIIYVKCPNCEKCFDSNKNFYWTSDFNGHPTVENLRCPHCGAGTESIFSCNFCPLYMANKCHKEEECGCCISFSYESFEVIE